MKILTICETYPTKKIYSAGTFFHVRNMYYKAQGHYVDVISFSTTENYDIDGINVYEKNSFLLNNKIEEYSVVVCHAPHYKTAIKFLKKHCASLENIVFFFHGNEVFDTLKVNPYTFNYDKGIKVFKKIARKIRDRLKLYLISNALVSFNASYVFVSNWMKKTSLSHLHLTEQQLHNHCYVINNSVGKPFELNSYDFQSNKSYDFITIRARIDGVKYGIDLVEKLALNNPNLKFLIIGQGKYFDNKSIPSNLSIISKSLNHFEIIEHLQTARCSLLPTRWDSQGLMTCETATFGMPTITSDIEICHEMLDSFANVAYIDNNDLDSVNLENILLTLEKKSSSTKNSLFFADNTVGQELNLFEKIAR